MEVGWGNGVCYAIDFECEDRCNDLDVSIATRFAQT